MNIDEKELELRKLAKDMVGLQSEFEKENLYEWDREEIAEEMDAIRSKILKKGYNTNLFLQYMEEYKSMTIEEYMKVYKNNN